MHQYSFGSRNVNDNNTSSEPRWCLCCLVLQPTVPKLLHGAGSLSRTHADSCLPSRSVRTRLKAMMQDGRWPVRLWRRIVAAGMPCLSDLIRPPTIARSSSALNGLLQGLHGKGAWIRAKGFSTSSGVQRTPYGRLPRRRLAAQQGFISGGAKLRQSWQIWQTSWPHAVISPSLPCITVLSAKMQKPLKSGVWHRSVGSGSAD